MWKLIYEPTAKFCVDANGNDIIFTSEEEALKSIEGMSIQNQDNYRGFDVNYQNPA